MRTDEYKMASQVDRSGVIDAADYFGTVVDTDASPVDTEIPIGGPFPKDNWALEKCGFRTGRAKFDARLDADPGSIAVIDVGYGALDHPSIKPVVRKRLQGPANASPAVHAAEVTGVIVSACPARVDVYNVATTAGLDPDLVLDALTKVASSDARVLNLSIGWPEEYTKLKTAIEACLAKGIVVVAAMGEYEEPNDIISYPAAFPGVIAVGATDLHDRRLPGSSVGDHIWIAAPGEDILTTAATGAFGYEQGTSFATPLVSAAAWLAVRAAPSWTPAQIRYALAASADATMIGPGSPNAPQGGPANRKWNVALGWGRLDVAKLETLVR